jgi:hypothetical protein
MARAQALVSVMDLKAAERRLDEERDRIALIKAAAQPPAECGPTIIAAPARGPGVAFQPLEMRPKGEEDWQAVPVGYGGRSAVRAADVFDRMIASAERAGRAWPLTPGQIAVGRRYRDLVEWRAAGAIKCSAIDGRQAGSGERDFMDAYLSVGRELAGMKRRMGNGIAMQVRRVRPSARGNGQRGPICDRALVDMVCLQQMLLTEVLRRHGWSTKGPHRDALREALSASLDRMIGYGVRKTS